MGYYISMIKPTPTERRQAGIRHARQQLKNGVSLVRIARDLKITRRTLYRWIHNK
jgi:transposase-like protein